MSLTLSYNPTNEILPLQVFSALRIYAIWSDSKWRYSLTSAVFVLEVTPVATGLVRKLIRPEKYIKLAYSLFSLAPVGDIPVHRQNIALEYRMHRPSLLQSTFVQIKANVQRTDHVHGYRRACRRKYSCG